MAVRLDSPSISGAFLHGNAANPLKKEEFTQKPPPGRGMHREPRTLPFRTMPEAGHPSHLQHELDA